MDPTSDDRPAIPRPLATGRYFLKIHPPDSNVSNPGKNPVGSATEGPFYTADDEELQHWISDGGNVGRALIDDLVVFDVDDDSLAEILRNNLPDSLVIRSGSGGEHWYYRCESWQSNRQFNTDDGEDWGSLRAEGWQTVIPPSVHPETGNRYVVATSNEVATISEGDLEETVQVIDGECSSQPTQAAAGGSDAGSAAAATPAARCVGSDDNWETPREYPDRSVSPTTAHQFVVGNGLDQRFDRVDVDDESGDDWVLCKCMAEAGITADVIVTTMNKHRDDEAKWHRRGRDYRRQTVLKAIQAACNDEYVEFDTADMGATEASERRKTEDEEEQSSPYQEVSNLADFNDHEEVTVLEGSEDGDSFKKVARTTREEDGETVEYVSLKSGRVELVQTVDGEEVLAQRVTDSKSLGSPDYIGDLAEALSDLDAKINGEE